MNIVRILVLSYFIVSPHTLWADVISKQVNYQSNGVSLQGFIAYQDEGDQAKPAVLVVHEWWGHNDYPPDVCRAHPPPACKPKHSSRSCAAACRRHAPPPPPQSSSTDGAVGPPCHPWGRAISARAAVPELGHHYYNKPWLGLLRAEHHSSTS